MTARSLHLAPTDWFWATWRDLKPLSRPQSQPFQLKNALTKLRRICRTDGGHQWCWHDIIPLSHTPEEAHFWLQAMTLRVEGYDVELKYFKNLRQFRSRSPAQIADLLSEWSASTPLELGQACTLLSQIGTNIDPIVVRVLAQLFSPIGLVDWMLRPQPVTYSAESSYGYTFFGDPDESLHARLIRSLTLGFRYEIVPYLSEDERELLQHRIQRHLDLSRWPRDSFYATPPAAFHLAAYLGMSEELQPLVESWPNNVYIEEDHYDYYHRPQEILFGLKTPEQMMYHLHRLGLTLNQPHHLRAWLAHTEYSALDEVQQAIEAMNNREDAAQWMEILSLVEAPETAPCMAKLILNSKAPQRARQWLNDHAQLAIPALVPVAAGRGKVAEVAIAYLQRMQRRGYHELIESVVKEQPDSIRTKVQAAVLEVEPERPSLSEAQTPAWLQQALANTPVPKRVKWPSWLEQIDLPPIPVGDLQLNETQIQSLILAIKTSDLDQPAPLIEALRQNSSHQYLAAFAWELFEQWLRHGAPSKDKWAMFGLGWFGDDAIALKFAPMVASWPGESQHKRAVLGLECLRIIGSDVALMQINSIAQRVKFKALKTKAQDCMDAIATARNLSRERLEDRIIPTCGLEADKAWEFDFGDRQFQLAIGADLKPRVRDATGKLRTNLPRPSKTDDPELAEEAIARWKCLKKQISSVVKLQVPRLEQALATQRRWFPDEFEALLVQHPLMGQLVRRLIWSAYTSQHQEMATFRILPDRTYVDIHAQPVSLDPATKLGLTHPLHLTDDEKTDWGTQLSLNMLVPPFPQLGRPVYRLPTEANHTSLLRDFPKVKIAGPKLLGTLTKRGWLRGAVGDGGVYSHHIKPFPYEQLTLVLEHDGLVIGNPGYFEEGHLLDCFFVKGHSDDLLKVVDARKAVSLNQVSPVTISEALHDLHLLL